MKFVTVATALFVALISVNVAAALRINEIMYNPSGNEFDFEYIELYSEQMINLTNYYFEGIDFVFPGYEFSGYLIIANTANDTGPNNDFRDRYGFDADFEFGGSLSNSGETLILYDSNGTIVNDASYTNSAKEDYSLEFDGSEFREGQSANGTPGRENSAIRELISETNTESNENNFSGCDVSISVSADKYLYEEGETVRFSPLIKGEPGEFEIEYYVTDINLNIIKNKQVTNNKNEKSFTPSIDEKDRIFFIHMNITPECEDNNQTNNYANASIVVRKNGEDAEKILKPKLEIKDIDAGEDHNAFFGETVKVKVDVVKGNSTKKMLRVYAEKISEPISIEIKDNQEVIVPIQLYHNCNDDYQYGIYPVIAEGFDMKTFYMISITGINKKNCEDYVGFADNKSLTKAGENQKTKGGIKSFYTRAKKFEANKTINLYANIDSKGNDFSAKITHNNNLIYTTEYENMFNLSASLIEGNNSFVLELYNGDEFVDSKNLSFYTSLPESIELTEEVNETRERFKKPLPIQEAGVESENESFKKKGIMSYALLLLSVMLNIALIWKR